MASLPANAEKAASPTTPWARISARFWVCLVVLVLSAIALPLTTSWLGMYLRKEAVPLRNSLRSFDTDKLGPRYVLNRTLTDRIPPMKEDQIESLGTDQYMQVYLTDTNKPRGDSTRVAMLFVTYYTGTPDPVPHVPDECWLASGYEPRGRATEPVSVPGVGAPDDQIPVRVLEFAGGRSRHPGGSGDDVSTVMYFFHANGEYATTRTGVRTLTASLWQPYAYYAKIEVTFTDGESMRAGKTASLNALGPLLERVMPVLLEDHLDLDKFSSARPAAEQTRE